MNRERLGLYVFAVLVGALVGGSLCALAWHALTTPAGGVSPW